MPEERKILLPDIGDFQDIDVIEVLVKVGDHVRVDDSLIVLETDKATMEIPSPFAGVIREMSVRVGDTISEGGLVCVMDAEETVLPAAPAPPPEEVVKAEAESEQP